MSTKAEGLNLVSGGGVAASHPSQMALPVLVGPATADEHNTIRDGILAVACWRMDDVRFEFDSSFIRPEAKEEFTHFIKLKEVYKDSPVTIFGHADPVGDDNYNKHLSGRRARAVYGLLTRNTDIWEELFKKPFQGDNWGTRSIQVMLAALGHYDGPINGALDKKTQDAVKSFQSSPQGEGLKVDGDPGKNTRPRLYKAYMDMLCARADGTPFQLDPAQDFLARGADAGHLKGDIQACSEFNPVLLFSRAENEEFKKPSRKKERDAINTPNRRVVAFFFRPGFEVSPDDWPCPAVPLNPNVPDSKGIKTCKDRFWSDGEARRSFKEERREYINTHDTFACRFYDRLARRSPCESGLKEWVIRILKPGTGPIEGREPLANEPFIVTGAGGAVAEIRGLTDVNGVLRFKVHDDPCAMRLKIAGFEIRLQGSALPPIDAGDEAIKHRLYNLGYGKIKFEEWTPQIFQAALKEFQKDHKLSETGIADEGTKARLREAHGS
jgi:hypothetical protein